MSKSSGETGVKKPKLTMKQAKFVKGIAEGKTQTQSALDAYDIEGKDPERIASALAVENLGKPSIKEALELSMAKLNLTPDRILKPIDDALDNDDVRVRLMGTDRALKVMQIGQPKGDASTINNFGQMVVQQKDKYDL